LYELPILATLDHASLLRWLVPVSHRNNVDPTESKDSGIKYVAGATRRSLDLEALVLFLLTLAAWWPSISKYHLLADDWVYIRALQTKGFLGFWTSYAAEFGPWRIVGHTIAFGLGASGGYVPALAFLLLHWVNACLLRRILALGGVDRQWALIWAGLFAAIPFGAQAGLWASAITYVMAFTFFLLLCLVLFDTGKVSLASGNRAWLALGLSLLSLYSNECLMFSIAAIALVKMLSPSTPRRLAISVAGVAPIAAIALFAAGQLVYGQRAPNGIHLRALISPFVNQWSALHFFRVWTWSGLLTYVEPPTLALFVIGSFIAAYFLWLAAAQPNKKADQEDHKPILSPRELALTVAFSLVSSGTIYALGGGYSLDSRKRYVIWGFIIAQLAALQRFPGVPSGRRFKAVAVGAVAACSMTSCIWSRLWEVNALRQEKIEQFASMSNAGQRKTEVHLTSSPPFDVPAAAEIFPEGGDIQIQPFHKADSSEPIEEFVTIHMVWSHGRWRLNPAPVVNAARGRAAVQ
jgi:hypothetical protein